jgi:hypothetical protein
MLGTKSQRTADNKRHLATSGPPKPLDFGHRSDRLAQKMHILVCTLAPAVPVLASSLMKTLFKLYE